MNTALEKIAITLIDGLGPILTKQLLAYTGDVSEVFKAKKKELILIPGIGEKVVQQILHPKQALIRAEEEMLFIDKHGIQVLFCTDKTYPYRLKNVEDSPVVLFYKGTADLDHHRIIGIIGTRAPTEQGKMICEKLIQELQNFNVLIVSGLAYGVDITAHRKCVDLNIPTLGIMGNGLDKLYPAAHVATSKKMILHGGLLTQFTTKTKPDREHFPMRNKVVAGLCDAIIVIESGKEGGSMITAEYANMYNKDVFAIPGRIGDKMSEGCHQLIKNNKASLIESASDVAIQMNWDKKELPNVQRSLFQELNEHEQILISLLKQYEQISIDRFYNELKLSPSAIAGLLLGLEFKGLIKSLPGKKYILI